jgi:hypothetical protein
MMDRPEPAVRQGPEAPAPAAAVTSGCTPMNADAPMTAVRSAVHALRGERERRGPYQRGGPWPRAVAARSVVARIGEDEGLADAVSASLVGPLAQLRDATTRYVVALRADGAPPERMLVCVKALVRDALSAEGWCDPDATQSLTAAVVGWSIDAYYDR